MTLKTLLIIRDFIFGLIVNDIVKKIIFAKLLTCL